MSRHEQLLQVVEQDMQQDCADYLALRGLMQELYQQLLERNCQRIDLLNDQIGALIERVRGCANRRSKVLAALRLGSAGEAMQQLLQRFPPPRRAHLQQAWQQLEQLVGQCKRLNERNGRLLAMHNEILDQLLGDGRDAQLYVPQYF